MPVPMYATVGPQAAGVGGQVSLRSGPLGDLISSQLQARYYESNYRGNIWMGGMTLTSISNATFTTGTLGATATPITGLYNPMSSGVNLVVLQAFLGVTITAATCTGGGPYAWMTAALENAISTGTAPVNGRTLITTGLDGKGSLAKDMSGVACTGKVNNFAIRRASSLCGGSSANFSFVGTAVGQATPQVTAVELLDGMIIVPPGGVLGLFATTTPVAHSAAAGIVWQEVAL